MQISIGLSADIQLALNVAMDLSGACADTVSDILLVFILVQVSVEK